MRRLALALCVLTATFCAVSIVFESLRGYGMTQAFGRNLSFQDLPLGAAVVGAFVLSQARPLRVGNRRNAFLLAAVGTYVGYQLIVVVPVAVWLYDIDPGSALRGVALRLSPTFVLFFYVVATRYVAPLTLVRLFVVAASLLALYAVGRYAISGPRTYTFVLGVERVREVWGVATILFGWCILAALMIRRMWRWSWAIVALNAVALVMTNHRSGYLALGVAVIVVVLSSVRVRRRVVVIVASVLAAMAAFLAFSPVLRTSTLYALTTMLNPASDTSAQDRIIKSSMAFQYFARHPLGDYVWSGRMYLTVDDWGGAISPHNFIAQLLGQQGLIATALFLVIVAGTLVIAWRNRKADDVSNAMLAFVVFYFIFCLFNTNYLLPQGTPYLWLAVALVMARERDLSLRERLEPPVLTSQQGPVPETDPRQDLAVGPMRASQRMSAPPLRSR